MSIPTSVNSPGPWKGELHGISQSLRGHVNKTTNDCQRLLNGQPPMLDTFMCTHTCVRTRTHTHHQAALNWTTNIAMTCVR